MNKNFITTIDWSGSKENPRNLYVLVSVEEKTYRKVKEFILDKLNPRHWRKFTKLEKTRYIKKFLRRWDELKELLARCDVRDNIDDIFFHDREVIENSKVTIIDDTIFKRIIKNIDVLKSRKIILESKVRVHYKP